MNKLSITRVWFIILLTHFLSVNVFSQHKEQNEKYVCLPCGLECDKTIHDKAGRCSQCGMGLVKKSTVTFKSIQPEELCEYVSAHPEVILLDVRSKREFEERAIPNYGTLKNAINIPVQEIEGRMNELNGYKNKEIIVYCSHSQRSSRVSYLLTQNGFMDVTNMAGGLSVLNDDSCKK